MDQSNPTGHSGFLAASNEVIAKGLEEMAAWLRTQPDMPVMFVLGTTPSVRTVDEFIEQARMLGEFTPERMARSFQLKRTFGSRHVSFTVDAEESTFSNVPQHVEWPDQVKAVAPDLDWGTGS